MKKLKLKNNNNCCINLHYSIMNLKHKYLLTKQYSLTKIVVVATHLKRIKICQQGHILTDFQSLSLSTNSP